MLQFGSIHLRDRRLAVAAYSNPPEFVPTGSRLRAIVLETRQQLVDGRQQLRAAARAGLEGGRVCVRYTALVDAAITGIYEAYLAELSAADAQQLASGWHWWRTAVMAAANKRRFPTSI